MPNCPVVCVWPNGNSFRVTFARAIKIVSDDAGEWTGRKTIRMKCQEGHGIAGIPEFHELRQDTSHWTGVAGSAPRLSEEKQRLLQCFKKLSA